MRKGCRAHIRRKVVVRDAFMAFTIWNNFYSTICSRTGWHRLLRHVGACSTCRLLWNRNVDCFEWKLVSKDTLLFKLMLSVRKKNLSACEV